MPKDHFSAFDNVSKLLLGHDDSLKNLRDHITGVSQSSALREVLEGVNRYDITKLSAASDALGLRGLAASTADAFSSADLALLRGDTSYRSALNQIASLGVPQHLSTWDKDAALGRVNHLALGLAGESARELAMRSSGAFADQFRSPQIDEVSRLLKEIYTPIERQYGLARAALESSLQSMRQPWLDTQDALASINGIAKLHGIGHLVSGGSPFDLNVAKILRSDLGDWRDPITWPAHIATDFGVRAGLYVDRGFNPALTEFPAEAFDEGLETAGLQNDIPVLVVAYGDPVPRSDDEDEEAAYARNNLVHDWLQRFETNIRRFIDTAMTAAHGSDWPRHRLPNGLYDAWIEKQSKDRSTQALPLICYADFTDYERIVCKDDNWKTVFVRYFRRSELVRESLQRLYPARLAAMHARPLMPEDELFAFAEIKRLVWHFQLTS